MHGLLHLPGVSLEIVGKPAIAQVIAGEDDAVVLGLLLLVVQVGGQGADLDERAVDRARGEEVLCRQSKDVVRLPMGLSW